MYCIWMFMNQNDKKEEITNLQLKWCILGNECVISVLSPWSKGLNIKVLI